MKIYSVHLVTNGESLNQPIEFSGFDARIALMAAIGFCKRYVKQGKHVRILCGEEIVWDSKKDLTTATN